MDYHHPNELRASSSAFAWHDVIHTDYNTGCLRKVLLQSKKINAPFKEKYGIIGARNEELHAQDLDRCRVFYEHNREYTAEVIPGVSIRGHADFVLDAEVHELKSVTSKNTRRAVFKNGVYKTENLAQLVTYMEAFRKDHGKLIYTWFDEKDGEYFRGDSKVFSVTVDDFGRIIVDTKATVYTIYDIWSHRHQSAAAVLHSRVEQRPKNHAAPFVSPCHWCAFKATCDAYDAGSIATDEQFISDAALSLLATETANDD